MASTCLLLKHPTQRPLAAACTPRRPTSSPTRSSTWVQQPSHSCGPQQERQQQRQRRRCAASGSGGSGDGESVDIDALAARLSAEAEKRRLNADDYASDEDSSDTSAAAFAAAAAAAQQQQQARQQPALSPFGYDSKASEADILAAVGEGGFSPEEFELMQELGTINIQQVAVSVDDMDDFPMPRSTSERSARTAVIAYTASFYSGMPFQDPVVTLAKEYLPGAKAVACNELQVLAHLAGMPESTMKWQVAAGPLSANPPIVRLLGYFMAGPTAGAQALVPDPEEPEEALWVVLKWEGLAPLTLYPSAQQTSGFGLGRLFGGGDGSLKDRTRMLKAITRGCLRALAFCHEAGVIHGALGSGSIMLSSFDDRSALRLIVKLDNFGFARKITMGRPGGRTSQERDASEALSPQPAPLATDDTPLALGQRDDLRTLSIVLLECILSALALSGPSQLTTAESLQRLLGDVFVWGVDEFRQYCQDEPDWQAAVELLSADGGAGWDLLQQLVTGGQSARELANSRFCDVR